MTKKTKALSEDGSDTDLDEDSCSQPEQLSADEIAEGYVSKFFGATPMPAPDEDDEPPHNESPIPRGDGIIYVGGFHKAGQLVASAPLADEGSPVRAKQAPELLRRKAEVRQLAENVLDGRAAAMRWMEQPLRFAFKGMTPAAKMATFEGCDEVEAFLLTLRTDE